MGATSGIGRCALDEAVRRGLPVRAFARSADSLDATDLVEPFKGDATSAEDVARALSGAQAVVYALGITERLAMLWDEETLFSETTRVLLEAMATSDVSRLVVVTGFGAGRSKSAMSWVEKTGHRAILGKPYADKDRQEDLIMASAADWTIARPVILTKGARTETYRVLRDPKTWRNGLISRASVAHYLIDAVEQGLDFKADVVLTR
ncbi:NAD(P)-dependent oxidoreductase [Marivita sp.]|jgi:putative NADH-flavin reductase|uniref:NAD(P)-dependent oxidoreductase n=1 Tax=Marivita sp. TaxID=2003365 RepID=UPI003F6C23BC